MYIQIWYNILLPIESAYHQSLEKGIFSLTWTNNDVVRMLATKGFYFTLSY